MHKAIILITKAGDKDLALDNVKQFMKPYGGGDVWDWYTIGGRWSGILAPDRTAYDKWAKTFIVEKIKENPTFKGYLPESGEVSHYPQCIIDDNTREFERQWLKHGYSAPSPYFNNYKLPKDGGYYDVVELKNCLHVLPDWITDIEKEKDEAWEKMTEARTKFKDKADSYDMTPYYAKQYYNLGSGNFSWEFGNFDIDSECPLSEIPSDLTDLWAVVVDMHN